MGSSGFKKFLFALFLVCFVSTGALAIVEEQDGESFVVSAKPLYGPLAAGEPQYPYGGVNINANKVYAKHLFPDIVMGVFNKRIIDGVTLKTPAFVGDHGSDVPGEIGYTSSHEEVLTWLKKLPTSRMKMKMIDGFKSFATDGTQLKSFELPLLVFSKPSSFTPEELRKLGKPILWLHGSIHGNEPSPSEALLEIASRLANGYYDDVLEKISVVMVPRFNIDGAWFFQRGTTALTNVISGDYATANNFDMNRDFISFEAPIVRAIRQLQMAYMAEVGVCGHQMGYVAAAEYPNNTAAAPVWGYRDYYASALTTTFTLNQNTHRAVRDIGQKILEPAIKDNLENGKVGWSWYIGGVIERKNVATDVLSSDGKLYSGDVRYPSVISDFYIVPDEGIGINGTGLSQSVNMVFESISVGVRGDYTRRVYSHVLAYEATMKAMAAKAGDIAI